jgi:putative endonuclease
VAICYILYSALIDQYYIGCTSITVDEHLQRHHSGYQDSKWSMQGVPWAVFLMIDCDSIEQARAIEDHIKGMKSRAYISNLQSYPEIVGKLKMKFTAPDC